MFTKKNFAAIINDQLRRLAIPTVKVSWKFVDHIERNVNGRHNFTYYHKDEIITEIEHTVWINRLQTYEKIVGCICHELRHVWQVESCKGKCSADCVYLQSSHIKTLGAEDYFNHPKEIDARKWENACKGLYPMGKWAR